MTFSLSQPALAKTTVIFLGDSLTAGFGVKKSQAYPALLAHKLDKAGYSDVAIINAGISGSTSASAPGRLKRRLKGEDEPEILVLALGANDGLRGQPVTAMKKNLKKTIRLAQKHGMDVLLTGMRIPPNYGPSYTKNFSNAFSALAKAEDVAFMPFLLKGVAAQDELNQDDGIHPNAKGHQVIAKNLWPHLKPLLPSRSKKAPGSGTQADSAPQPQKSDSGKNDETDDPKKKEATDEKASQSRSKANAQADEKAEDDGTHSEQPGKNVPPSAG